jgi:uncharacterized protein (TIRG00374 family)
MTPRRIASLLVAIAFVAFVVLHRHDIGTTTRALRHAELGWVAFGALLSTSLMVLYVFTRRAALVAVGVHLPLVSLVRAGVVAHSLNIVAKSGGVAGLSAYRREAVRAGQPGYRVTAGYMLVVVMSDIAFALILFMALVVLLFDGQFSTADAIAAVVFTGYFVLVLAAVASATQSRASVRWIYSLPSRVRSRVFRLLHRVHTPNHSHDAADELFDSVQLVRRRPSAMVPALAGTLAIEAVSVAIVWVSLRAFGVRVGLTVPLVGYAVSTLFSIVGVLPAGLGFAEASLGAVLVSYSVSGPVAAAVVIAQRTFEVWIPLAAGALAASVPVGEGER